MTIAVVYLARKQDEAFLAPFLDSYKPDRIGIPAELIIAAKGWRIDTLMPSWGTVVTVPDEGYDIGTYRYVAERITHEHVVFLNSFSRPLVDNWLGCLYASLKLTGMHLVGCTGSHEPATSSSSFPNPHIRTNAFIIWRKRFLHLDFPANPTRQDCLEFETGKNSMAKQIGIDRCGVIGLAGFSMLSSARDSCTFRWGNQKNLLVADNRTDNYQNASPGDQEHQQRLAWGITESSTSAILTV